MKCTGDIWACGPTIGKGSSSTISLAILNGEPIASKSSPLSNSSILQHEKSILTDLSDCPQIIKCLGHDITEDRYNLFLEYLPGGHLSGPLPEPVVKRHTRTLIHALSSIHAKGYVHCDLKSHNLLTDAGGNLKVADFGLAKRRFTKAERSFCGTPLYMSPEAVVDGEREAPTDI